MITELHLKPGARGRRPGFLKSFRPRMLVYVCVSAPRPLITSGVIWCDIGRVQLVKQVYGFSQLLITSYGTCGR